MRLALCKRLASTGDLTRQASETDHTTCKGSQPGSSCSTWTSRAQRLSDMSDPGKGAPAHASISELAQMSIQHPKLCYSPRGLRAFKGACLAKAPERAQTKASMLRLAYNKALKILALGRACIIATHGAVSCACSQGYVIQGLSVFGCFPVGPSIPLQSYRAPYLTASCSAPIKLAKIRAPHFGSSTPSASMPKLSRLTGFWSLASLSAHNPPPPLQNMSAALFNYFPWSWPKLVTQWHGSSPRGLSLWCWRRTRIELSMAAHANTAKPSSIHRS